MNPMDANRWNERYTTADYVWRSEPNVFLASEAGSLPSGRALDLACGEGRNAVWLATRGWTVTGVDFSDVGLDKARRMAAEKDVDIELICADVTTWEPPSDNFDLVAMCYLQLPRDHRRAALGVAARAIAPGGTLVVVAHDSANLTGGSGGPSDPDVLYRPSDVVADLDTTGIVLTIERAETVERIVPDAELPALDCVVRARRDHQVP